MKGILLKRFYGHDSLYLVIATGIIAAFILLILYPTYRSLGRLDMEIREIKNRIEQQKVILPLYYELDKRSKAAVQGKLPLPAKDKIAQSDIRLIPSIFSDIAADSGTEIISVNPDVTTLTDKSEVISVSASARGDFSRLRDFLVGTGKLPYLRSIERIEIRQEGADKQLDIKMLLDMS
ncbi:MAG: hypothetical protein JXB42_05990 [Deltaproteobacteria bacterium]|nr:hypothetical protein [Deltaproteobacteria bacterium]